MSENTDEALITYPYNIGVKLCNICKIPIYFCNIHLKRLQHTSETSETLEMYACSLCFSPFFFRATQREWRISASRRPRMGSGLAVAAAPAPAMGLASNVPLS